MGWEGKEEKKRAVKCYKKDWVIYIYCYYI